MRRFLFALLVLMATPALAQNQLPAIQGPSGYQLAGPTVNIGYDSGSGAACVVGKTATCALVVSGTGAAGGASIISTANSSAVPLGANLTFTGTGEDVTQYASVTVTAFSNVASATNGLSLQMSTDNTNWDILDAYTVSAGSAKNIAVPVFARYFRVVYTNGAGAQASFRLQTVYHARQPVSSSLKAVDGLTTENDTQLVTNLNMLKNSSANATADMQRSVEGTDGTGKGVTATSISPNSAAGSAAAFTANAAVGGSLIAKASPGNLYALNVTAGASALYVMVTNTTTVPADGAVTPVWCMPLAANAGLDKIFNPPLRGTTGLTVVASTTGCYTKTISATAFISAQVQ